MTSGATLVGVVGLLNELLCHCPNHCGEASPLRAGIAPPLATLAPTPDGAFSHFLSSLVLWINRWPRGKEVWLSLLFPLFPEGRWAQDSGLGTEEKHAHYCPSGPLSLARLALTSQWFKIASLDLVWNKQRFRNKELSFKALRLCLPFWNHLPTFKSHQVPDETNKALLSFPCGYCS